MESLGTEIETEWNQKETAKRHPSIFIYFFFVSSAISRSSANPHHANEVWSCACRTLMRDDGISNGVVEFSLIRNHKGIRCQA